MISTGEKKKKLGGGSLQYLKVEKKKQLTAGYHKVGARGDQPTVTTQYKPVSPLNIRLSLSLFFVCVSYVASHRGSNGWYTLARQQLTAAPV